VDWIQIGGRRESFDDRDSSRSTENSRSPVSVPGGRPGSCQYDEEGRGRERERARENSGSDVGCTDREEYGVHLEWVWAMRSTHGQHCECRISVGRSSTVGLTRLYTLLGDVRAGINRPIDLQQPEPLDSGQWVTRDHSVERGVGLEPSRQTRP
jgi:hypothetical protein